MDGDWWGLSRCGPDISLAGKVNRRIVSEWVGPQRGLSVYIRPLHPKESRSNAPRLEVMMTEAIDPIFISSSSSIRLLKLHYKLNRLQRCVISMTRKSRSEKLMGCQTAELLSSSYDSLYKLLYYIYCSTWLAKGFSRNLRRSGVITILICSRVI